MATFKDNEGKDWDVFLTVGLLEKIRDRCDVDLGNAFQNDATLRIDSDVILLCNVMYVVCEQQCHQWGVSDEDFGRRLVGQAIDNAREALFAALLNFFPPSKARLLKTQLERQNTAWETALAGIEELATPEKIKELVLQALQDTQKSLETSGTG